MTTQYGHKNLQHEALRSYEISKTIMKTYRKLKYDLEFIDRGVLLEIAEKYSEKFYKILEYPADMGTIKPMEKTVRLVSEKVMEDMEDQL